MGTVYFLCDTHNITSELYEQWLNELPPQRRELVERRRMKSDKLNTLIAYLLLRYGLKRDPGEFVLNEHGKPELINGDEQFSISHTKGCVAVAISREIIGVDCEKVTKHPDNVAERVFTEAERQLIDGDSMFFKLWTLKESYVKATGEGMSFPLREVEFSFDGGLIHCSDNSFLFASTCIEDYIISVCSREDVTMQKLTVKDLWI